MSSFDFSELDLAAPILRAVQQLGYEQPSPIQAQSIPILLEGRNLLGVAQTGTGKTAAFSLPLLSRLDPKQNAPQILVLTPTRELAIQVAEACQSYARFMKGFHVLPVYGGQDMRAQLKGLKRGSQVVVGTPGRVLDHMRRGSLDLTDLRALVLDEADEMLRMGFIDDVETVMSEIPEECQRALFSATMPAPIRRVVKKYLGDAQEVTIKAKTRTVERITQHFLILDGRQKLDALTRILEVEDFDGMIIFVRTKSNTVELAEKLEARGFSSAALNGDLSQTLRERTINRLKKGQIDILVATDVAARGLDVERISHVINYDIPYDNEAYIHRIGRTGRAGREGKAILFVAPKEQRLLRSIEKSTRQQLTQMALPTGEQVSDQRVQAFERDILQTLQEQDLSRFKTLLQSLAHDRELSMSDIAASLAWKVQQERPLFPKLAPVKSIRKGASGDGRADSGKVRKRSKERGEHARQEPTETFRMEVGADHGVQPKDIVGAIANEAGVESQYINQIKIHADYSTVELPLGMPADIYYHLKNRVWLCQQPMRLSRLSGALQSSEDGAADAPRSTQRKPRTKSRTARKRGPREQTNPKAAANRKSKAKPKTKPKTGGRKAPKSKPGFTSGRGKTR